MKRTGLEALRGDLDGCDRRLLVAIARADRLSDKWEETRVAMEDARGVVLRIELERHRLVSAIRELERRDIVVPTLADVVPDVDAGERLRIGTGAEAEILPWDTVGSVTPP